MLRYCLYGLALIFTFQGLNAQVAREVTDKTMLLQDGPRQFAPNLEIWDNKSNWQVLDKVNDHYYGFVQVNKIMDASDKKRMKDQGIDLLEYVPHFTYYARISGNAPISAMKNDLRGVYPIGQSTKTAPQVLERPFPEVNVDNGKVWLRIYAHDAAALSELLDFIRRSGGQISDTYRRDAAVGAWLSEAAIAQLQEMDALKFVELFPAQGQPEDVLGRSLHRVNRMQGPNAPLGNFTGEGIDVIVRDDGIVGPHIDFQGRLNQQFAFNEDPNRSHGDGVSGILGGAGNLDPDNAGMATGATLHILNYRQDQNDSVEFLHKNYGAVIVSTSYSDGCNVGYTGNARTIDRHTWENPTLLHVFSAGNSNNNNCGYGAGNQWGNITGGHKMAKNSIATANVFYDGTLVGSSSRGPAHDGRLKPEISAFGQGQISTFAGNVYDGFGGTSAAAPGISGVSACLNEAFRTFNNGNIPDAALIKAAMLNAASELGEIGPDFQFGFGLINGYRALQLIEKKQYQYFELTQGSVDFADITIDRPAKAVKVMVYWTDEPGALFTRRALVNDVDLVVLAPDQTAHYPLVLDPTPDPVTLAQPAVSGVDHLNNVEQVVIRDAEAGTYRLQVTGFEVPSSAIKVWVVYEVIYDEIDVSYPSGGETFQPGTTESIRWDAPIDTGSYDLSYSLDGGANWFNIATVNRVLRTYDWTVPMTRSGKVIMRITRSDGLVGESREFSIYPRPENIEIIAACPEAITVRFDSIPDAQRYIGYLLKDRYMEEVSSSDNNVLEIPVTSPEFPNWFAVVAEGDEGKRSKRTIAMYYDGGLLNCPLDHDLKLTRIVSPTPGEDLVCLDEEKLVTVEIENNGQLPQSDFNVYYQVNGNNPVSELFPGTINPGERTAYTFSTPIDPLVARELEVWYELPDNDYDFDDRKRADLNFIDRYEEELPYIEDFDDYDSLLLTWLVEPSDEEVNWVTQKVVQSTGSEGFSLAFNNYQTELKQKEFGTQSGKISLAGLDNPWFFFDLSYANRDASKADQLALEISIDCGNTFERVLLYNREQLNTWNALPVAWVPRRDRHWRTDSLSLGAFAGEDIVLRWVNISAGGNNVFIDNFRIEERMTSGTSDQEGPANNNAIALWPNPAGDQIHFESFNGRVERVMILDPNGRWIADKSVRTAPEQNVSLDISDLQPGMYFILVQGDGTTLHAGRFIKI